MKKYLPIALLGISLNALAFQHWNVKTEVLTLNPEIPTTISNLDLGYDFGVQYNLNPNLYTSVNTTRYDHSRWSYGATAGITDSAGYIRPYAEVNYNRVPTNNKQWLSLVGYDVGMNAYVFKGVIPYIEFDNFFQKQKEAMQVGLNVPIGKRFSIGGAFAWQPSNGHNGANVKMSVSF